MGCAAGLTKGRHGGTLNAQHPLMCVFIAFLVWPARRTDSGSTDAVI